MDATNNIATDLFYKIRSRFTGLKLGAETGQVTINPEEARFFDFDYVEEGNTIGHVSISLAEDNSMKVYFSTGITESMNPVEKKNWYKFLRELRMFAKRRLMSFDTRDITKDNLDKRDFSFLSQNSKTNNTATTQVGESVMNESSLYGSKTMSYQKLEDTRLIIKHSHALADDMQPGARSRNISALFVENGSGERFKYPFIHLAGARAMQRHVANGGMPYDDIGKSIIGMSEEIAQLKSFGNYVVRNDLMNSDTNGIVERSSTQLNSLREMIAKIAKQAHYEAYKNSFQAQQPLEVPQDVVEQFTDQFTVKNFKEDIKSVFPVLYRLMQEDNTIGYDDIVAMTTKEDFSTDDDEITTSFEAVDPFARFENWAMSLGEESGIQSDDQETKATAIKDLQELVGQHFPAGDSGMNAIQSLKGIIDDPRLFQEIKNQAKEEGDDIDTRGLVMNWLEQNSPEMISELDFGDFEQQDDSESDYEGGETDDAYALASAGYGSDEDYESADPKAGEEDEPPFDPDEKSSFKKPNNPNRSGMDSAKALAQRGQQMNVKEIAEFVHSFYDQESATFPKGPEGVATMVGKKFGEQAEAVARKFVERMAPQQQAPELAELARIKQLSGM
jgi:hypothetical protein